MTYDEVGAAVWGKNYFDKPTLTLKIYLLYYPVSCSQNLFNRISRESLSSTTLCFKGRGLFFWYTHENKNPKPHTDDGSHGDTQAFETSH